MFENNPTAVKALDLMLNSTQNVYLTGDAGTGKSTLLKEFVKQTTKKVVILAPTGMAAVNVGGETIHSFCKFGAEPGYKMLLENKIKKLRDNRLVKSVETIIIDEISMVRADLLDCLDIFLRVNTLKTSLPFGGVQVICFGDHFQLPPILKREEKEEFFNVYQSEHFFGAKIFQDLNFKFVKLTHNYRQSEASFIKLLNYLKYGVANAELINWINNQFLRAPRANSAALTLTAFNADASDINSQKLDRLTSSEKIYKAEIKGEFSPEMYPTNEKLLLKIGSQVMFVKNDPDKKYVNGTLGKVVELTKDKIGIKLTNGKTIDVGRISWEIYHYEFDEAKQDLVRKVSGIFLQFPLKLAWAVTIHKSQGQTFDNCIINLGRGAFVTGQTYVAFSRCRTMEGLQLSSPLRLSDVKTDPNVFAFDRAIAWNK